MKNLILKSTLVLGAAVLMGVSAQAQSLKISVPFGFEANGKSMPAGEYRLAEASSNGGGMFTMRGVDNHESVLLPGKYPIENRKGEAKLVFAQLADGFYLTEVWDGSIARAVAAPHGRTSIVAATRVTIPAHK